MRRSPPGGKPPGCCSSSNALFLAVVLCLSHGAASAQSLPLEAAPLALERVCSVGADDGPPEQLFGRIGSVSVAPDGAIYVLDAMEQTVRTFDSACNHIGSFGRRGPGPGEFRSAVGVRVRGDTVYVFDAPARRQSLFTRSGEYIDSRTLTQASQGVCCGYRIAPMDLGRGNEQGWFVLVRGNEADTLIGARMGLPYGYPSGNEGQGRMLGIDYGFSAAVGVISDSMIVVVDGYTMEMRYYALSQANRPRLHRRVTLDFEAPPLSAADRRRNEREAESVFGGSADVRHPERWSLATNVLYDGSSRLWVRTADPGVWLVGPVQGSDFRAVRLPERTEIKAVTPTHLFAATTTPNGAPVLVKYALPPN